MDPTTTVTTVVVVVVVVVVVTVLGQQMAPGHAAGGAYSLCAAASTFVRRSGALWPPATLACSSTSGVGARGEFLSSRCRSVSPVRRRQRKSTHVRTRTGTAMCVAVVD